MLQSIYDWCFCFHKYISGPLQSTEKWSACCAQITISSFCLIFFCHRYMLLSSVDNFNICMVHKRKYTYGARLFHSMCYYFHFVHTNIPCCPFKYSLPQIFEWYMPLRYGVEYSSPLINLPFLLSSVSVYFFNVLPSKL